MRILWSSNAFWAATGYAVQAKHLLPRFQALGHDVAQFAWFGLQGSLLEFNDLRIYPRGREPWGTDTVNAHVKHFGADLLISLQDIWVLPDDYRRRVGTRWAAWFPIDHSPAPKRVIDMARTADYPINYSQFGREEARKAGLECRYIPHGCNTDVFKPGDKAVARRMLGLPESAYICTMVAANKGYPSRKAFPEQLAAFAHFYHRHPGEAFLYLHTSPVGEDDPRPAGGIDLEALLERLGVPTTAYQFVNQYGYQVIGLPESHMALTYQASDALLAATMSEGFGIPIIEAQACGVPVITTNATSMPELTVNGLVVDPLQPAWTPLGSWVAVPSMRGIARALETIYEWDSETRRKRAALGRSFVVARYAWDVTVEQFWQPFFEQVERDIAEEPQGEQVA